MTDVDHRGFEAVFDEHFEDIYKYIAFRLAPKLADAQDIAQETFMGAFKSWGSFRGDSNALQWVRSIARRKVADYFKRKPPNQHADMESLACAESGNETSAGRAVAIASAMRSMPPEYVELLEDKYLEGLSVRQIASKQQKSEKAVESALSRARAMLRERYSRYCTKQETHNES